MAIKKTADYEPYTGYTTYEGTDFPGFDWTFNEEQGGWSKPTLNPNTPSQFSLEDIKNRSGYAFDPNQDKLVSDSADKSLDPNAYYNQLAKDLSEASYGQWSINGDPSQYTNLIESLKEVDPKAYYTAKIDTLSRGVGHNYQANESGRGDVIKKQLQDLIPEAQKAGLTPEEISSLYGSGYSSGAQGFSQILANQQEQGGTLKPLVEGIKFVGPGLLGMYGIDTALTAGLGAGYGAATGMSSTGIGSGLGGAAAMEGGALASSLGGAGSGLTGGTGAFTTAELMGPTYGELGFTGVEGGFAGPTYAEMGFTGLNQAEAIALADAAAAKGISVSDAYKAYNRAKQVGNLLSGNKNATGASGINPNTLATALKSQPAEQFGGLYRMNQNPFAQTQQPTSVQNPFGKTQDFLAQLSKESKTEPTLADLLRNA